MATSTGLETPLRSHEEVIARARKIGKESGVSRVVVAAAEEDDVLAALHQCQEEGIARAILVGRMEKMEKALEQANVSGDQFELIAVATEEEAAQKTAEIAGAGDADVVMKGFLKTSTLLKTLLKHEYGLRDRELLSHSAVLSIPRYDRLLNITDGGTVIAPTREQKAVILANAANVMRSLGIKQPSIAILGAASEDVLPGEESDQFNYSRELVAMAAAQWKDNIAIDGPVPFNRVVRAGSNGSPVNGNADILLGHTIEQVNILAKTLIQFGNAVFMGVITGARIPISLVSRSDSMLNKKSSVALAVCVAHAQSMGLESLPPLQLGEGVQA